MNRIKLLIIIVLLVAPSAIFAAKPINNLIDVRVPTKVDGKNFTMEEMQTAIVDGCIVKGWTPLLDGEGVIRASIMVRGRHFADIEIPFSRRSYSIIYKYSENLDYDENRQRIHRNYNRWVIMLSEAINTKLRMASYSGASAGRQYIDN
jgi:hypothetical protein